MYFLNILRLDVLSPTSAHECRRGQGRQGLTKEIQVYIRLQSNFTRTIHDICVNNLLKTTPSSANFLFRLNRTSSYVHYFLFCDGDTAEGGEGMPDVRAEHDAA